MSGIAALEAIDLIVASGGDADDVLRAVVGALIEPGGADWAGVFFVESGELVLGPQGAGSPAPEARTQVPVLFQDGRVAELAVDRFDDAEVLDRIAFVISPFCLVGWDTDGVPWDEA